MGALAASHNTCWLTEVIGGFSLGGLLHGYVVFPIFGDSEVAAFISIIVSLCAVAGLFAEELGVCLH